MREAGKVLEPFAASWWRLNFFGASAVRRQDPPDPQAASAEGFLTLNPSSGKSFNNTRPVPASTKRGQRNLPYDPPACPVRAGFCLKRGGVSCRCKKKQKKALERIELSTISYFVAIRGTPVQLRTSGALPLG